MVVRRAAFPGNWRTLARHLAIGGALFLAGCTPSGAGGAAAPSKPAGAAPAPQAAASGAPQATGAAASGGSGAAVPVGAPELVKVGTSTSVGSTGFFIGLERGYYQEQGLDVEIVPFEGATEMIPPLAASQIDVTNADAGTTIFNALGRDLPLHFVAEGNHTSPGHSNLAWVVRKDLADSGAMRDLTDLRGKRISPRARGSLVDMLAHRTLALAGLGPDDVDLQYILSPNVMPAFANGALDAAILGEPLVGA